MQVLNIFCAYALIFCDCEPATLIFCSCSRFPAFSFYTFVLCALPRLSGFAHLLYVFFLHAHVFQSLLTTATYFLRWLSWSTCFRTCSTLRIRLFFCVCAPAPRVRQLFFTDFNFFYLLHVLTHFLYIFEVILTSLLVCIGTSSSVFCVLSENLVIFSANANIIMRFGNNSSCVLMMELHFCQ